MNIGRIRSPWREIRRRLFSRMYIDAEHRIEDTVLLSGSGRGGTTWVADLVNAKNTFRLLFEPFLPRLKPVRSVFQYYQYIRPDDESKEYRRLADRILSGQYRLKRPDSQNRRFWCRRRLIKDIFTNLMLPWLHHHYPLVPKVLLLRHPFAVAHSKCRWGWKTDLDLFLQQEHLMEDYLHPFHAAIRSAASDFECHVVQWCIEMMVPLQQLGEEDMHVAFYELLCTEPEAELKALYSYVHVPYDSSVLPYVHKPSFTANRDRVQPFGEQAATAWCLAVSPAEIKRSIEILDAFGLAGVYNEHPLPVSSRDDLDMHRT